MIARLLGILALVLLVAPAESAPIDWTRVAARTAAGGIRVGNPKARIAFVEIANYTCPHCAHFSQAGAATLARQLRGGRLQIEYRPIVNNDIGMAATIVARCAAPTRFLAVNDALYARQDRWLEQAAIYVNANADRLRSYSELDQLRVIAEQGGIRDVAVAAGVPAGRITACFADRVQLDATLRAVAAASAVTGSTPTFLIEGKTFEGLTWPDLSARLSAAGLK